MLAVEILVEEVVVAFAVLEEQGRRSKLACLMALLNEVGVLLGIAHIDAHHQVPVVGDGREPR